MAVSCRGRNPAKRDEIVLYIRRKIVSGEWPPTGRLPPRSWFETKFNVAAHTVQSAFRIIMEQGFLVAERRLGTRVHPRPPHLAHYAVWAAPGSPLAAAVRVLRGVGRHIRIWNTLDAVLLDELAGHCYAGIFLGETPPPEWRKCLQDMESLPVTGLFPSSAHPERHGWRASEFSGGWQRRDVEKALVRQLMQSGVRRVALLRLAQGHDAEYESDCRRLLLEGGASCPAGYFLEFSPDAPEQCANVLRVLFAPSNPLRPDGVAVLHEKLLPFLAEILSEVYGNRVSGVRVASFGYAPQLPEVNWPVRFLGVDMVKTLLDGLRFVDECRMGMNPAPPQIVRFEKEE